MSIVEIFWELGLVDSYMQDVRREFLNRKKGRPKRNKELEKIGIIKHSSKISDAYVFEFYLQFMRYPAGAKAVLAWCREHLKSKELEEQWHYALMNDGDRKYFDPILNDNIFLSKVEENYYEGFLSVSGKQVFENPFNYVLKHVWIWNSALEYCLNKFDDLDIRGEKAIAFRAFLNMELKNTHAPIDSESYDRYVRSAKDYIRVKPKPD